MTSDPKPLRPEGMAHHWKAMTVDQIKSPERHSCVAGPFGSSISSKFFMDVGVPIIRGSNLSLGLEKFVADDFAFISEETAARFTAQTVVKNDLVFTCWGTIGQVGLIPEHGPFEKYVISNKQLKLRVDNSIVDPLFAYYYFSSPIGVQYIKNHAIGSAVPGINLGILKSMPVPVPPLSEQRRIVSIIGAYDDLIEVNRRRIAVLEAMARGLFEEWFVRFRFPGHEATSTDEAGDGSVPASWQRTLLSAACSFVRGRSYRSTELAEEGGMPFVNLKCVVRDGGFRESGLKRFTGPYKANHTVVRGDFVMAVTDMTQDRRLVGRVARIPLLRERHCVISMDLVKVVPYRSIDPIFLYAWFHYSDFGPKAAQIANGANVLHLSPAAVGDFPIVVPPVEKQKAFADIVGPLIELMEVLAAAERPLTEARDLLLPRLISGELSVAAASRELEAAA